MKTYTVYKRKNNFFLEKMSELEEELVSHATSSDTRVRVT